MVNVPPPEPLPCRRRLTCYNSVDSIRFVHRSSYCPPFLNSSPMKTSQIRSLDQASNSKPLNFPPCVYLLNNINIRTQEPEAPKDTPLRGMHTAQWTTPLPHSTPHPRMASQAHKYPPSKPATATTNSPSPHLNPSCSNLQKQSTKAHSSSSYVAAPS